MSRKCLHGFALMIMGSYPLGIPFVDVCQLTP